VYYPYQVVIFIGSEPELGELVFNGSRGWHAHLAVKRRYSITANEQQMLAIVQKITMGTEPFQITLGDVKQPDHMPVEVIEVEHNPSLTKLHNQLFEALGPSKYPGREGTNYYPHVTISWKGEQVIKPTSLVNTSHRVNKVWVIKDGHGDSRALTGFTLGK
jgi:hypothetical protein